MRCELCGSWAAPWWRATTHPGCRHSLPAGHPLNRGSDSFAAALLAAEDLDPESTLYRAVAPTVFASLMDAWRPA